MRLVATLVLLVLVLTACASQEDLPASEPNREPTSTPTPTEPAPDPGPPADASGTEACAEVRAGVNAFNRGDFDETVDHFRLAVPLAEDQARTAPSRAADDLLEAVHYYADLPAEDYLGNAATSRDFARFKTITLLQCVTPDHPLDDVNPSPGLTA